MAMKLILACIIIYAIGRIVCGIIAQLPLPI